MVPFGRPLYDFLLVFHCNCLYFILFLRSCHLFVQLKRDHVAVTTSPNGIIYHAY